MSTTNSAAANHLEGLCRIQGTTTKPEINKSKSSLTLLGQFLISSITFYISSFSLLEFLQSPLSFLLSLVVYPIIWYLVVVLFVTLALLQFVGGQFIIDFLSTRFGGGYSIINWSNPAVFQGKEILMEEASELFGTLTTTLPADADGSKDAKRIFSLPLAKACLLFSALVYERKDNLVEKAVQLANINTVQALDTLRSSEAIIRQQATAWGLQFHGISDLDSIGGPYFSLFASSIGSLSPWVVVCFKGTTPSNYSEFLIDLTIQRRSAKEWLGDGTVHSGFYEELFGDDGYSEIVSGLRAIGKSMNSTQPIPLWITGHSLGSALSSLLFYRLLSSPSDLLSSSSSSNSTPIFILKDCYSFGTPSLGSTSLLSNFASLLHIPFQRPNILWRVVDGMDIVCKIPIGCGDENLKKGQDGGEGLLDYGHLGTEIVMSNDSVLDWITESVVGLEGWKIGKGKNGLIVVQGGEGVIKNAPQDDELLQKAIGFLPPFFLDHFPSRYYHRLELMQDGRK